MWLFRYIIIKCMNKYELTLINECKQDELLGFLNRCFKTDFKRIVPKIYEHPIVDNHYVVRDGERIVGAICIRYDKWVIKDQTLDIAGIGSVCVDPEYRNQGIMTYMLNEAHKIIRDQSDISILSGNYERYHHFGYERVSSPFRFEIDGESDKYYFTDIKKLSEEQINDIYVQSQDDVYIKSSLDDFRYSLCQWDYEAYGIFYNDKICGYIMNNDSEVAEIRVRENIKEVLRSFRRYHGINYADIAPYEYQYINDLDNFKADKSAISELCRIFNYEKVIEVMLNHKNQYNDMPSGEVMIMIDGYGIIDIKKDYDFSVDKKISGKYDCFMSEEEFMKYLLNGDFKENLLLDKWFGINVYLYVKDLI